MKQLLSIFLLTFSCSLMAEWIEYSTKSNGDVFFYDNSRIEKNGNQISVWTRVRYKTSVMAASSYQSLLKLDCATPAMATNTNVKPKKMVEPNSATGQLIDILCKDS